MSTRICAMALLAVVAAAVGIWQIVASRTAAPVQGSPQQRPTR